MNNQPKYSSSFTSQAEQIDFIHLRFLFFRFFLGIFVYLVPHSNSFGGGLNRRSTPPNEYQTVQSNNFDGNNHAEGNLFRLLLINYMSTRIYLHLVCLRFCLLLTCTTDTKS